MNSIIKMAAFFYMLISTSVHSESPTRVASKLVKTLSIVSDLGEVINVTNSLSENRLHFQKLEHVEGVLSINADYLSGLLYVVQDTLPNQAMTHVYSLKDLNLIATLPGVTNVEIPKQFEAKLIISRSYKFSVEYSEMFLSELLQNDYQKEVLYEVRDRQSPKKTLFRSREIYDPGVPLFWLKEECYRPDKSGFADYSPLSWFTAELKFQGLSRGRKRLSILDDDQIGDCTSNGAFWLHNFIFKSEDTQMEIRFKESNGLHKFIVNKEPNDFPILRALGESAAVVFYEDVIRQRFTLLEVGREPVNIKLAQPMRGVSTQLFALGWDNTYQSYYFVGGRRMKGGYRVLSNQVFRLAQNKNKWALSPVDLDQVMLMYLEHRRSEATRTRPVANGQLITTKPKLRLDGNEELFRVIGVF